MNVVGVVMAGGNSSRMGRDKALVSLGEHTLLDIAVNKLKSLPLHDVQVSRNKSEEGFIQDVIPNKGPLSSIHAACLKNPQYDLLFLPVDLPLVSADLLMKLVETGTNSNQHVSVAQNNLPLFLKNTDETVVILENQLNQTQNFSMMRFFDSVNIKHIPCKNQDELININSPDDLQKAQLLL
ncbi:MAG: molybdenum cofactor guanylyltransferase [Pseudomonadota bacterium]